MIRPFDLLVRGGVVVNQDGVGERDIGVRGDKIAAIGDLSGADAAEIVEAGGLVVLPGLIDTQVHFREPGAEHKEDLATGSRAAVLGGVTTVLEMPNTQPPTTSAAALQDKLSRAAGRMHCDHAFWIGATAENVEEIPALERLTGAAGMKVFMGSSTGDLLVADDETLSEILSRTSRRAAFHAEDEGRLRDRLHCRVAGDPASHPVWRDVRAALGATERLVRIARRTGAAIHVLHVSTAEELAFLRDHKDLVSIEATPHHLTLTADDYPRLGTLIQMNPPVRESRHRDALWQGLADGTVDVLGSDHAPHTRGEKARPYPQSPSGMTGVQTLLPVMLDHVAAGRLSLLRLADLTSAGPARIFGIAGKGRIAVGYDADLAVVDPRRRVTITDDWIASRSQWTPYAGREVAGWPVVTILRGRRVMEEGEIIDAPAGRPARFIGRSQ